MFKASWRVLRSRKELAVFPVLSGAAGLVVAIGVLLFLPTLLLVVLGIAAGGAVAMVLVGIAVLWFLGSLVVTSALSGIYQTALYHYAASRSVPQEFAGTDLGNAFPQKRR
jgi:hypothetical protein